MLPFFLILISTLGTARAGSMYTASLGFRQQCVYYVDTSGSDSNNGRSSTAAFATVSKATTVVVAGQRVCLKAGDTWHGQLILSANYMSAGAYGAGAKPIVDGAVQLLNASFALVTGTTYSITPANSLGTGYGFVTVYVNGTPLTRATSLANCESTSGTYYPTADSGTPTLNVNNGTNVITDGNLYEYSIYDFQVGSLNRGGGTYSTNILIDGIQTSRPFGNLGSINAGNFSTIQNCVANSGNVHNILIGAGSHLYNCTLANAYHLTISCIMSVVYSDSANSYNTIVESVTATMATACPGGSQAFYSHTASGSFGTITYLNDTVGSSGLTTMTGSDAANTTNFVVKGGSWTGNSCAGSTSPTSVTVSGTAFNCLTAVSFPSGATITASNLTGNVSGTNSSVIRPNGNNSTINLSGTMPTGTTVSYLVYSGAAFTGETMNLSAVSVPGGYQKWFGCSTNCTIVANNLSLTCNGCASGFIFDLNGTGFSYTGNNNTFSGYGSGTNRFRLNATSKTWATWLTAVSPQDNASTYTP